MTNADNNTNATERRRAIVDAQTTQADQQQYSGGNAMLDAQIQADMSTELPETELTVTNAPKDTSDVNKAEQIDTTGAYPPSLQQLEDESDLSVSKDNPNED